jgi:hypothetical protein
LDHKLSRHGNRFRGAFLGCSTARKGCSDTKEGFLLGGLSPPNKKTYLLGALGASAVKILFCTRMKMNSGLIGEDNAPKSPIP